MKANCNSHISSVDQNGIANLEICWAVSFKFKYILTNIPTVPDLGTYTREKKTFAQIYTRMFAVDLHIIAPNWKQPKCPLSGECIKSLLFSSCSFSSMPQPSSISNRQNFFWHIISFSILTIGKNFKNKERNFAIRYWP